MFTTIATFALLLHTVTLTITVNNDDAYVYDGEQIMPVVYNYNMSSSVSLAANACVLSVLAVNIATGGSSGILASTSTGVVTDDSWKCSSELQTPGWHEPNFDDAAWAQARVVAPNDGSSFAFIADISPDAKWIWAEDTSSHVAFCRKTLC